MKIMFISDIHGISKNLSIIGERFAKEKCDKLVVLGDLFYDGPKNKMAIENNKQIKEFLHSFKSVECIRGNCDNDENILTLDINVKDPMDMLTVDNIDIYVTHGHLYNDIKNDFFNEEAGVLVFGHYHYPKVVKDKNMLYICVGSISLPRNGYKETYVIYKNKTFTIYDIENNIIQKVKV